MRAETKQAVKKLRSGKTRLSDVELTAFFDDVRTFSDSELLPPPARAPSKKRTAADPTVLAVAEILKPIDGYAKQKAELLVAIATRHGKHVAPLTKSPGIPEAVRKLRGALSDEEIVSFATVAVRELANQNRPEHKVA